MNNLDNVAVRNFLVFATTAYMVGTIAHVIGRKQQGKPTQVKRLLIFVLIYAVAYGALAAPPIITTIALSVVCSLAANELFGALARKTQSPQRLTRFVSLGAAAATPVVAAYVSEALSPFLFVSFAVLISLPILNQDYDHALSRAGAGMLSLLFAANVSLFLSLQRLPRGIALSFWLISLISATDVYSILFGGLFGKHPLWSKLSPGKTVEGSVLGLIFASLTCYFAARLLLLDIPVVEALVVGATVSLAAQVGDLTASIFKREAGIKDYGTLIPYQGGILDRFDSCILAVPVFYWLVTHWMTIASR